MLHSYKNDTTDPVIFFLFKLSKLALLARIHQHGRTYMNTQHLTFDPLWVPYMAPRDQGY